MRRPLIAEDRACDGCGYNLRGLRLDGRCPECGRRIHVGTPLSIDDPMSLAPRAVIRAFRRGTWLASGCVVGWLLLEAFFYFGPIREGVHRVALLVLAAGWCLATWLLTPSFSIEPARFHGFGGRGHLRIVARVLQGGWLLAAVTSFLPWLPGAAWVALAGALVGLAGLMALSVVLMRLADWVRDDTARRNFNWFLWGVVPGAIAFGYLVPILGRMPLLGLALLAGGILWVLFQFPVGVLSLGRSMEYTMRHARDLEARGLRQRERRKRFRSEVTAKIRAMDEANRSGEDTP